MKRNEEEKQMLLQAEPDEDRDTLTLAFLSWACGQVLGGRWRPRGDGAHRSHVTQRAAVLVLLAG